MINPKQRNITLVSSEIRDKNSLFHREDYDSLIELITTSIKPDSWSEVGGACSIAAAPLAGAEMLVIDQTCQVHQDIENLLEQLRAIAKKSGSGTASVREKPSK